MGRIIKRRVVEEEWEVPVEPRASLNGDEEPDDDKDDELGETDELESEKPARKTRR